MKVKVGDAVYDGNKEPVMVILTEQDKKNIANMHPEATRYCVYPTEERWKEDGHKAVKEWMNDI